MAVERHILVVDDEEEVRDTLYNVLKSLDYKPMLQPAEKKRCKF
ncbi:MAG: hypothetical protein P8X42_14890 [Calditrichaceae bacterium]